MYNIWGIGQGTFQIPSYISLPNGSTYEFESVTGFKPDIKEDYSDYAFYIDINKPSSKGATSVDVGGNMEMRKLWEAARKPVLMDSEGNYVELRKDNWRTTIDGIYIISPQGLDLDSSCAHCDIMEIIPEYYYKVQNYKFGESDMCRCWFSLSPIPGGRKIAQQVVGKFKAHIKDNNGVEEMRSIPNVVPSSDKTIREFWLCARNKSENHGLADINFRNYLMFHTMSKYKTRNVQSLTNKSNPDYVGASSNTSWKGLDGSSITLTETQISQGITEFDLQRSIPTGLSYSVESDGAYFADLNTKS